jgi:hypothetical protein
VPSASPTIALGCMGASQGRVRCWGAIDPWLGSRGLRTSLRDCSELEGRGRHRGCRNVRIMREEKRAQGASEASATDKTGIHTRRGRRPRSQAARARGTDVQPARGRAKRRERRAAADPHARGEETARIARAKRKPTRTELGRAGSRTTVKQRKTRATKRARKLRGTDANKARGSGPTRRRSTRKGARASGTGMKRTTATENPT